jgi:hypothetical protein
MSQLLNDLASSANIATSAAAADCGGMIRLNINEMAYIERIEHFENLFLKYTGLIMSPIGLMLNTLMIIVYSRKSFRKTTMGFYYVILGFFDNIAIISLFTGSYRLTTGLDFLTLSELSCRLTMYFVRMTQQIPGWIEVLITYDRLAFVAYPNRFQFLRSRLNITLMIAGIILVLCCVNSVNLWLVVTEKTLGAFKSMNSTSSIKSASDADRSCVDYEYLNKSITLKECSHFDPNFTFIRDILSITSRIILPFVFMTYGNLKLAMKFIQSKERMRHDGHQAHQPSNEQPLRPISSAVLRMMSVAKQKELAFVKPIILMDLLFIFSLLPVGITAFVLHAYKQSPPQPQSPDQNDHYQSHLRLIQLLYNMLIYISTMSLSLSCVFNLFFNRLFKHELFSMLKLSSSTPSSSSL